MSAYRLVAVPALNLMAEVAAENVRRYVESGGTLRVPTSPASSTSTTPCTTAPAPEPCGTYWA
ncbi:hypothetical protein B0675_30745 [Streptomyces sp. M41(2017)]|nr:hypothetical protein B0675_30745 [Streptomyces sp. M41(2017)]